jgi:predicted RNA binding protein YcfA (HicA-like mRNA interferase family)
MNLPATQTGFNALSPQQQQEHRAKIGVRAQAILGQFWHDADTPDAVKAIEIEGWMDVLENCSHSEIRDAWRDYQIDSKNRTARGRLAKPDAGALRAIILRKRPKPELVKVPEPEPSGPRVTKEQAAKILEEAGFKPRKFGGAS